MEWRRFLVHGLVSSFSILSFASSSFADEGLIFSVSGNATLPNFAGTDTDLLGHRTRNSAFPLWTSQGVHLALSDLDGDGTHDDLKDIDALAVDPSAFPGAHGILFSLISDASGLKDGDVFTVSIGGAPIVVHSEDAFIQAVGATDGNVDVDAFHYDADADCLIFSFAENEASSLLSGSESGVIQDEEILCWPMSAPQAFVLHNAVDVQDMVAAALGIPAFDVKDVLSLTQGPASDLWFTIQSPSEEDATVFSTNGTIVEHRQEQDFGFTNNAELDAMAWVGGMDFFPAIRTEPEFPAQGDNATIQVWGAQPRDSYHVLLSGSVTDPASFPFGGFGGVALEMADPFFMVSLRLGAFLSGTLDDEGSGELVLPVVPDGTPIDIAIQVWFPAQDAVSHPIWCELNQ